MQSAPSIEVRGPAGDRLKALVGIGIDLRFVADACKKLQTNLNQLDPVTQRALWSSAVIGYGRCFKSGRRQRLPADVVDGLNAAQTATHAAVLEERDRHIAHQVNEGEQVKVAALVGVDAQQRARVIGIGLLGATRRLPDPALIAQLAGLAEKLHADVKAKLEKQQQTTPEEAQELFDKDEIST